MGLADFVERSREEREEATRICESPEMMTFTHKLFKKIAEMTRNGIRIIVDVEPILYESALFLVSFAVGCINELGGKVEIEVGNGERMIFQPFMFEHVRRSSISSGIKVVFTGKIEETEWQDILKNLVRQSNLVYVMILPSKPLFTISTAYYVSNLVLETVRETIEELNELVLKKLKIDEFEKRLRYVGRVPHEVVLFAYADVIERVLAEWQPPPPEGSDYLKEKPRALDELVIPDKFKELLKHFIRTVKIEGKGSLMLVGLPASGKKTIAMAIAKELGYPAYIISLSSLLSRYVGESEAKMKAFFESLRAKGGLAVFEGIENLFTKSGSEQVSSNLRSILFSEMAREDNNFVMVFTSSENVKKEVFSSPLLGELKLVMPLPVAEERRVLARKFLREIAGKMWPKLVKTVEKIDPNYAGKGGQVLELLYAEPFVKPTAGFTSGEIYRIMKSVLLPVFEDILREKRLININEKVLEFTKIDHPSRLAKIRMLIDISVSVGRFEVADMLKAVGEEVEKIARDKLGEIEKYKF